MKATFTPQDKKSKREQKAHHAKQRKDWGGFNPITRTTENGKAYNRKKSKQCKWHDHEPAWIFLFAS